MDDKISINRSNDLNCWQLVGNKIHQRKFKPKKFLSEFKTHTLIQQKLLEIILFTHKNK